MLDARTAYSIQYWLESCPQGYLLHTEFGHERGAREPGFVLENPVVREEAIGTTVQLVVGERAALAASSGLINAAPDAASKAFLATQTLDEARHVEIFTQRLFDLGVKRDELESTIAHHANPHLVRFAEILLEKVDKKDFVAGVVGQNIVLEGLAFSTFEMMQAANRDTNPKFARTLSGTIADERRHVGFGENRIGSLLREQPGKKPEIERMQKDMAYHMLATLADRFRGQSAAMQEARRAIEEQASHGGPTPRSHVWHGTDLSKAEPREMEAVLAETVLKEFKTRLARIGLDYQSPERP
ncbi:MAG: ferritin-like domain-containing protein [Deltaproteobacteria bacterium]|nr:ferritin-like domain-containing protein [Deltaproteobacteria bacterium]